MSKYRVRLLQFSENILKAASVNNLILISFEDAALSARIRKLLKNYLRTSPMHSAVLQYREEYLFQEMQALRYLQKKYD